MSEQANALADLLSGPKVEEVKKPSTDTTVNKFINCKSGQWTFAIRIFNTPAQRGTNATQRAIQQALADATPEVVERLIRSQGIEVIDVKSAISVADTDQLDNFTAALALAEATEIVKD